MDDATQYRIARLRLGRAAMQLDDDQLRATCPSCPDWTNQDVIAHHVHYLGARIDDEVPPEVFKAIGDTDEQTRLAAGRVRDEWTQAGVDERRGRSVAELLAEWDRQIARKPDHVYVTVDAVVHLGDVLEAVGERRGIDTALIEDTILTYLEFSVAERVAADGHTLTLRCSDTGARIGCGPGAFEVSGTGYELLRAIAGRRTRAEADATLDWGGAPESVRAAFSAYGWPER